jgi:TatD DNase family protein
MNVSYIDSHAHIYLDQFRDNINDIIQNSLDNNVNKILMPNINLDSVSDMLRMSNQYKGICYPMLGLHPCYITKKFEIEIDEIFKNFSSDIIAIGEIGLDFFKSKENKKDQIKAFEIQCEYAVGKNKPIVIHTRNSIDETIKVVKKFSKNGLRGVFHCFSGTLNQANEIIDLGFKIGVGGVLTFKNSNLKNVISKIDLEHIILETDSPYLSPEPRRGSINEPANIIYVSKKLSEICVVPQELVSTITSKNVINLFDLQSY